MIDWEKEFPVVTLSRLDLSYADLTNAEIATLSDADMEAIAKNYKRELHTDVEQLQFIARLYLAERAVRDEAQRTD